MKRFWHCFDVGSQQVTVVCVGWFSSDIVKDSAFMRDKLRFSKSISLNLFDSCYYQNNVVSSCCVLFNNVLLLLLLLYTNIGLLISYANEFALTITQNTLRTFLFEQWGLVFFVLRAKWSPNSNAKVKWMITMPICTTVLTSQLNLNVFWI